MSRREFSVAVKRAAYERSNGICLVDGCEVNPVAKNYCRKHYSRFVRYGNPLEGRTPDGEPNRFIQELLSSSRQECTVWPFATKDNGYGTVTVNGRTVSAHRHICGLFRGPPPFLNAHAAHSCGNRSCVNPRHIEWKTKRQNESDKSLHGTKCIGSRHGGSILSERDVRSIRAIFNGTDSPTKAEVAKTYGVTRKAICAVVNGRSWRWLDV